MRTYGSIQTCFWEKSYAQRLSDQGKLLATYLLTGPHTNMLGCFRLPLGYISEDLNWDIEKVKKAFNELSEVNFITRDESNGWLIIQDFLKWNPIQNPKQAKGVQKLFDTVPDQSVILDSLIKNILIYGKYFETKFLDRFKSNVNESKNPIDTLSEKTIIEQDQEHDQVQEQEKIISSLREDVVRVSDNNSKQNCPHEEIINLYHETLHMCPPVRVWNKSRRGYLKQRWAENIKHQKLEWWKKYFEHVKQSDFLTGKTLGREGKPPFVVDLEWLVRPNNFAKVIEGKYHGERL